MDIGIKWMKNKKLARIKELRGVMLGLEMNLKLLDDDLGEVDKNLTYLHRLQSDLVYNINLHKSGKVITIMTAYKRSIDELELCRTEITKYRNFRSNIQKELDKKIESYDYYLSEYERSYDDLNNDAVVLLFRKDTDEQEKK